MNFGFQLPGPFRIGVSSKGRVTGGMSLGPMSVSGQIAGPTGAKAQQGSLHKGATLEEAIEYAESIGCRVTHRSQWAATVQRGWWAWHIQQYQGGVQIRPSWSLRMSIAVVGAGMLLFTALCVWMALASR